MNGFEEKKLIFFIFKTRGIRKGAIKLYKYFSFARALHSAMNPTKALWLSANAFANGVFTLLINNFANPVLQ
ncbi:hypothetical protein EG351_04940 [Chryseobacterium bernardetii]|nr:hypothetical protein EG351_04940 [Chryseobacterium bernardetii]